MIQRNKEAKGYFQELWLDAQSSAAAHNSLLHYNWKMARKEPLTIKYIFNN